ncbi:Ribonuclease H-like domain containing protein [Trema orientale]|uniref:Ribonuclease H-like domain containing protein n=1 Tax=Trema orientale TaxID=63057 RepID=A0A2P5E5P6_TREOI|nr:Ribonuclease H-like domain containing protein [Trema orientale]
MAAVVIEAIWMERNSIVHRGVPNHLETIIRSTRITFSNYMHALSGNQSARQTRWEPPMAPWIKINMDATIRAEEAAETAVVRDDQRVILSLTATPFPHPKPVMAEATAMLLGLQHARDYAWSSVIIKSDCLNLVNCWNGSAEVPWSAAHILQRI